MLPGDGGAAAIPDICKEGSSMQEKKQQGGLWHSIRRWLGFYRNPPYIANELKEADVRSALFLTAVVSLVEIWMLVRYVVNWVLPGKVASVAEFFHYTYTFWWLLAASAAVVLYSALYMKGKLKALKKYSSALIFAYFALGIYFGIVTGMHDFSRGRMITCFLTMLMYATIICIWRPFSSVLLVSAASALFVWLLNNRTFDKAGNALRLSEGDYINFLTFIISLFILEIAVYFQRYSDATKSWKLQQASVTDDLTGIPNMRKFDADAREYMAASLAEGRQPLFLVFDLANFQTFNDRFNYAGGDQLLISAGGIVAAEFPGEPAARESGDVFCVLTNAEDYQERAARVRQKILALHPSETYLDVKVGAYRAKTSARDPRHAIDRARYALRRLRNRDDAFFLEYDEKMSKEYKLRQYVLNHVEEAVREGWIQVYYQPVLWAEDGTLAGCEALARWIDPQMGFLSPGVFIPTLEEGRQIHKLDLCVYESVCKRIRDCMDRGLPVLPTSMNFSRLDFELMDAVGELEALVAKYRIPKEYLHVEITESAITADVAGLRAAINRLHEQGYVVWLDDFGSGYSSMNVLKDFDFDLLKIDMEFLKNFHGNQNARKIISSIIDLARDLGMLTLSEGVETEEAVDFLRSAGCGRLQGFYYGKPMPYEDILAKIREGTFRVAERPEH